MCRIGVNLRNREIKLILDYNAIKANKIKQYSTPNGVPLSWDLCILQIFRSSGAKAEGKITPLGVKYL